MGSSIIKVTLLALLITAFSCKQEKTSAQDQPTESTSQPVAVGSIERIDKSLDAIMHQDAKIEIIAKGFDWSEGPLWVADHKMLLFSDVPKNTIYKWTEAGGVQVYLTPSGYMGKDAYSREPGSNGLTLQNGKLIICQHGERRIASMNASLTDPKPVFTTIAGQYDGKKLNSPNDAVCRSNGDIFFTDPPYGLPRQENSPTKETPFQGVYKVSKDGKVKLLVDSITRPNGIAFLPGEKTFIVSNSDPAKALWYAFDLDGKDNVTNARIFYSAQEFSGKAKGLPDGMKVDKQGNIFASGPGGIWIFNKEGKLLGKIKLQEATSNCTLADDDKTLYLTSDMNIVRVKMR
jgi:gluconolactonase